MTMVGLAMSSLRRRRSAFAATFLSLFLGSVIVMAFAAMIDTGTAPGADAATEERLITMGSVVGGWGAIIVVYAVISTLTLAIRQRAGELALLKSIGATPGQVRRMLVGEAFVVSVVATMAAVPLGALGGWVLLEALQGSGQVGADVSYVFGSVALAVGFGITVVGATVAADVAARRTAHQRARDALITADVERGGMSRKRKIAAWGFLALGLNLGIVTAAVYQGKGIDAMPTAGQASIWFALGLALFAPALVRAVTRVLGRPLELLGGSGGYLAVQNMRRRTHQMAGALMPIILFTGIATGTLYIQSIENSAPPVDGTSITAEDAATIETLNFVVVAMIAAFAAILVINTLVAATTYRQREFGQQRLAGSTPPQVLGMVGMESLVLASAGVLFGSVASIVAVVPYSIARTDSVLPDTTIGIYLGVVTIAAALTFVSSLGAARRAIRVPSIDAVTA